MKKVRFGTFEQCIFCGIFSEFVGILQNAKDCESYCPFCGKTQKQARKKYKLNKYVLVCYVEIPSVSL